MAGIGNLARGGLVRQFAVAVVFIAVVGADDDRVGGDADPQVEQGVATYWAFNGIFETGELPIDVGENVLPAAGGAVHPQRGIKVSVFGGDRLGLGNGSGSVAAAR